MKAGIESLGRLRLQAVLLLAVVFVLGGLVGVALDRVFVGPGGPPHHEGPPPRGLPPELREGMNLTPEQEKRIQAILDASRPRTDAVLDEFLPRLRVVADSVRMEIRGVLNSEQRVLFDQREPTMKGPGAGHMFGEPANARPPAGPPDRPR
jgi:hypothetical protein